MNLFLAIIHWTNDAGNQAIVGIFDSLDRATDETRRYYESVQGAIRTETLIDRALRPGELQHRMMAFNGELDSDMNMPEPHGSADIYETALNETFSGSLIAQA